jgi:hypothetical protein
LDQKAKYLSTKIRLDAEVIKGCWEKQCRCEMMEERGESISFAGMFFENKYLERHHTILKYGRSD